MLIKRRSILRFSASLLAALAGLSKGVLGAERPVGLDAPYPLTALSPYLDILIPGDTESAAASELQIDEFIRHKARLNTRYILLLREGCRWLDAEARKSGANDYAALHPATQEEIVARAAGADEHSLQRVFFERTRLDAMDAYYSDPRSWPTLGFSGPPQPIGYPDHAAAPNR